jgi:hypothetical protein
LYVLRASFCSWVASMSWTQSIPVYFCQEWWARGQILVWNFAAGLLEDGALMACLPIGQMTLQHTPRWGVNITHRLFIHIFNRCHLWYIGIALSWSSTKPLGFPGRCTFTVV